MCCVSVSWRTQVWDSNCCIQQFLVIVFPIDGKTRERVYGCTWVVFFEGGALSDLLVTCCLTFTCHHVSSASFQPRHWENFILKKARKRPEPQQKPIAKLSTGKYGLVGVSHRTLSTKTSLLWWKIDFSGCISAEKLCRQQLQSTKFRAKLKFRKNISKQHAGDFVFRVWEGVVFL